MEVINCPGCHKPIQLKLSTHRKKTPFAKCDCGFLGFWNGQSGEEFRRLLQRETHKKESEGWF
jgi:hypothetical protein